jgi:hypothetical protein
MEYRREGGESAKLTTRTTHAIIEGMMAAAEEAAADEVVEADVDKVVDVVEAMVDVVEAMVDAENLL